MINLTITAESGPDLQKQLLSLMSAGFLGGEQIDPPLLNTLEVAKIVPLQEGITTTKTRSRAGTAKPASTPEPEEKDLTELAKDQTEAENKDLENYVAENGTIDNTKKDITIENLRAVVLGKPGKKENVKAILDKYKATRITELKEEDYPAFLAEVNKL